jgi:outer membrane protein assembly factor BamB
LNPSTVPILSLLLSLWLSGCGERAFRIAAEPGVAHAAGGFAGADGADPPLQLAWTAKLDGPPLGGAMLYGNSLLQLTTEPSLFAFDRATGKPRGRRPYEAPSCATPIVADSIFILSQLSSKPKLQAYHAVSGRRLWARRLNSCLGPSVRSDTVLAAEDSGTLWALRLSDGAELWRGEVGTRLRTTPVPGDGIVVLGTDSGVVAIDSESGAVLWRYRLDAGARSRPVVTDAMVFASSGQGQIAALTVDGDKVWHQRIDGLPTRTMALSRGYLVVGSSDRGVYALDVATGAIKWRFESKGVFTGGPTATDRTVYCAGSDYHVYALDIESGSVIWKYRLDGPAIAPVLVGRQIVSVASEKKTLYGFAAQ